jgi:glycosyltransferase involved in cell wall biosynthesis
MTVQSIIIVSDFACINGGQAKVAIDSARLLADEGFEVTFFAAVGPTAPLLIHPRIKVELLGQTDILSEPNRVRAMLSGIWNEKARRRLIEVLGRFDPKTSIVHCHGYAKALSPAIGPVLTNGPLRAVYTMHEYFLACPNGGFYDYQKNEICRRRALGVDCLTTNCDVRHPAHKAWRVVRQAVTRGPGRMPHGLRDVIYISETQRRVMAPYLSAGTRLHYVPNPIATPDRTAVTASQNKTYLFVGRLNPEKGCVQFAQAARRAGVPCAFVCVGSEAEAIRRVNPDAALLGWKASSGVQEALAGARALVFPSLWYETFGLAPLEALALGVPVVAGRWSAATEFVEDGINGVLYDRPDVEALAQALRRVASLPDFDPTAVRARWAPKEHLTRLLQVYGEM